jgi:RNA polymerase sigma-70 factor (ECF subfamily)
VKSADAVHLAESTTQEAWLVQRAVSGDAEAFAGLYETYADRIYRFIFFRVGDSRLAEDLTSQTFLKAWESLGRYQIRGLPFGAWLFRIARNKVIDNYRVSKETVSLETALSTQPDPHGRVDEKVEGLLEVEQLRVALRRLTAEQRQVLTLKFIEGLSTKEISQVTGKQEGAIRALQMRGLQALAHLLEAVNE